MRPISPDQGLGSEKDIVTDLRSKGVSVARYRLRLEPFLAFLRLRRDAFIFQDKDAQQIVTDLMADYPQANFAWDVTQNLQKCAISTQYRESDLEFLTRLLASEGLSYRFEHDQAGSGSRSDSESESGSASHAKHQLVIFDAHATAPAMPGESSIRYHGVRATEASDSINQFAAIRQVQSNAVTVSSWDFAQVSAPASELSSSLTAGELPALSIYDGVAERAYTDSAAASDHSELQLRALEMQNKRYQGGGAVRQLAAGHAFTLSQHAHYLPGDDAFTVLSVEHTATNNIAAGVARLLNINELERGTYRNTFSCVRQSVPIVPAATAVRRPPSALGT